MQMKRSRRQYFDAKATAEKFGLSGPMARLGAMVIAQEQALNHRTPSVAEIRQRVLAEHPEMES